MARTVHCIKLDKEAEGLDFAPYPGDLGKKIWESVSKEAWAAWLKHQTMLVNEKPADENLRAFSLLSMKIKISMSSRPTPTPASTPTLLFVQTDLRSQHPLWH